MTTVRQRDEELKVFPSRIVVVVHGAHTAPFRRASGVVRALVVLPPTAVFMLCVTLRGPPPAAMAAHDSLCT